VLAAVMVHKVAVVVVVDIRKHQHVANIHHQVKMEIQKEEEAEF
jgi:hypothetical protein